MPTLEMRFQSGLVQQGTLAVELIRLPTKEEAEILVRAEVIINTLATSRLHMFIREEEAHRTV